MNPSLNPRSRQTTALSAAERRRHQRVRVNLIGRFMLADRREFPCQVTDMSPGGAAIVAPVIGSPGEHIVAYIDHIGRIEGIISRQFMNGFAMTIRATDRKRDKLATQLTWLANRKALGLAEDRRHERIVPKVQRSQIILPSGTAVPCRVRDVSLSGAAVDCSAKPAIGAPVMLGKTAGRVARHFEGGFAIEFSRLLNPEMLEESVSAP